MDIAQIKPHSRTIEILDPRTDEPIGIRITLCSIDDDRLKAARRAINDEALRLQQRGKAFKSIEVEANTNKLLFGAAEGWEWYNPTGQEGDAGYNPAVRPDLHGDENPTFNQKNFIDLITSAVWARKQINEALDEEKAFFENSGSN